ERKRIGLDTAADRREEERFLFEIATSRATERTILSYAQFDERGEETLPSFFLELGGRTPTSPSAPLGAHKPDAGIRRGSPQLSIDPRSIGLAERHKNLSPTAIESFLQCPFQFFANKTLRLRRRPAEPRDRLDVLAQGRI